MLRVLLYENTGGVTACTSHLESGTCEAPQVSLCSNGSRPVGYATDDDAWAHMRISMKAYPGYDGRPLTTGLNRGGGSDPLTSELDVQVTLLYFA